MNKFLVFMVSAMFIFAFVHMVHADDESDINEYGMQSLIYSILVNFDFVQVLMMHNSFYKNVFLVSHFLANNVEKLKKNMKNGIYIHNFIWIVSSIIIFSCERALGINKVTGLQRWCPKLEVYIKNFIQENISIL